MREFILTILRVSTFYFLNQNRFAKIRGICKGQTQIKCRLSLCKVAFHFLHLIKTSSKLNKVVPHNILTLFPFAPWAATYYSRPAGHLPLQSLPSVLPLWGKPVLAHPPGWAINTLALPVCWCCTEVRIQIAPSLPMTLFEGETSWFMLRPEP